MSARAAAVRSNRPRGIYVPAADAPLHLAQGWRLLDDCPPAPGANLSRFFARDEVLLLPPSREEAA